MFSAMPKLQVIDAKAQILPPAARPTKNKHDLAALQALVVSFGPRQAARLSGIPAGTVLSLSHRYHWKCAQDVPGKPGRKPRFSPSPFNVSSRPTDPKSFCNQSPGNALGNALTQLKHKSTMGLATYSAKAATALNKVRNPLDVTRKAVDISDVHKSIWPAEGSGANILQIGFLVQGK
jgi:hypothetical protein